MKIKSLLIAFCALVISCSAFSQDSTKTMHHRSTGSMHHHKHHGKHHKHMMKADKKEAMKK